MGLFDLFGGVTLRQKLPPKLYDHVLRRLGSDYENLDRLMKKFDLLNSPIFQRIKELENTSDALDTQAYFFATYLYSGILSKRADSTSVPEVITLLRYSMEIFEQYNQAVIGLASLLMKVGAVSEAKPFISKAILLIGAMLQEEATPMGFLNIEAAKEGYNDFLSIAVQDFIEPLQQETKMREISYGIRENILSHVHSLYMWSDPKLHFLTGTKMNIEMAMSYFSVSFINAAQESLQDAIYPEEALQKKTGESFVAARFAGAFQQAALQEGLMYVQFSEALHPLQATWEVKASLMSLIVGMHEVNEEFEQAKNAAKIGVEAIANLDLQEMSEERKSFFIEMANAFQK